MEKTPKHFRAAHPLLFIASILLAGIIFAKLFVEALIILSISKAIYLLILSLVLLQFIIICSPIYKSTQAASDAPTFPLSKFIEGLTIYGILL